MFPCYNLRPRESLGTHCIVFVLVARYNLLVVGNENYGPKKTCPDKSLHAKLRLSGRIKYTRLRKYQCEKRLCRVYVEEPNADQAYTRK